MKSDFTISEYTTPVKLETFLREVTAEAIILLNLSLLMFQEYHDNIGDLDGPEEKERAQTKIQRFITAL